MQGLHDDCGLRSEGLVRLLSRAAAASVAAGHRLFADAGCEQRESDSGRRAGVGGEGLHVPAALPIVSRVSCFVLSCPCGA